MDGRRMTGPEPWMASTDDAMEAQPCCRCVYSIEGVSLENSIKSEIRRLMSSMLQSWND